MKHLVIYHRDCQDGMGAALAAWMEFGDEADYLALGYTDKFNHSVCEGREVFILDFSFPLPVMADIIRLAKRVTWLDHHQASRGMAMALTGVGCPGRIVEEIDSAFIVHDNDRSGALLAWDYFQRGEAPPLIQHIDDYDRWQFELPGSREIHAALESYKPWALAQWNGMAHPGNYGQLYAEGLTLLRQLGADVASLMKQATSCGVSGFPGLACNSQMHPNELGHELANQSGTYGLVWYVKAGGQVKCSLRSNGDYDVDAIARQFGGGGHKNSAGFEIDVHTMLGWLK